MVEKATIEIRNAPRDLVLRLCAEPPHCLVVERLEMVHRGHRIHVREGKCAYFVSREGARINVINGSLTIAGSEVGIAFQGGTVMMGTSLAILDQQPRLQPPPFQATVPIVEASRPPPKGMTIGEFINYLRAFAERPK